MSDPDRIIQPADARPPMVCIEAERGVLGCCVIRPELADQACEKLNEAHFSFGPHRLFFRAISEIVAVGGRPAVTLVFEHLRKFPQVNMDAMTQAWELAKVSPPNWLAFDTYVNAVREASARRSLVEVSGRIAYDARDPLLAPGDVAAKAHDQIDVAASAAVAHPIKTMSEISEEAYANIQAAKARGGKLLGPTTGIPLLDYWTKGWRTRALSVVAGRPSSGKSSALIYSAVKTAQAGNRVVFFSLEMNQDEVWARMLSVLTGINTDSIETDSIGENLWHRYNQKLAELNALPICILDNRDIDIPEAAAYVRQVQKEVGPVDVAMFDHLHEMALPSGEWERTDLFYYRVCKQAKSAARSLGIPWVMAAQLSRKVEGRPNKRPMLSDLRDSGGIEAAADLVVMLYRARYYEMQEDAARNGGSVVDDGTGAVEFIVAKQRQGPKSVIALDGALGCCRFTSPGLASPTPEDDYAPPVDDWHSRELGMDD